MSRSKKDILETEAMLARLTNVLHEHANRESSDYWIGRARADAESLYRVALTLRRWFEGECNGNIQRDEKTDKAYLYNTDTGQRCYPIADRERGARKRLYDILAHYPGLEAYVQTDPRGCALYILKPGDVPAGEDVSGYYSRGLAVFQ